MSTAESGEEGLEALRREQFDALFLDNDVDFVVITGLGDRSLLKESTPKMFDVHDPPEA